MSEKQTVPKNIAAERAVLAGICKYGQAVWSDIVDITDSKCFTDTDNQIIFSCIKKAIDGSDNLDIPSIMSAGNALGLTQNLDTKEQREFIRSLFNYPIEKDNVRKESVKLKKLEIARRGQSLTKDIYYNLAKITGTESVSEILGYLEKPLLTFGSDMDSDDNDKTELLMDGMEEFVKYLEENEGCLTGIPSPFAKYNEYIGGGRRRGGVYLVGARPKCIAIHHKVLTESGFKPITDIKLNDYILTPDGKAKVIRVLKPEMMPCYTIKISDGTEITSSYDHQWPVVKQHIASGDYNEQSIVTTEDIFNNHIEYKYYLKRKNNSKIEYLNIKQIRFSGQQSCVCLTIDSPDSLFIIDSYIITHNCGKSTMALNDALHIASKLNLPVLYLDTEMTKDGQRPRLLSNLANLKIKDIEGGKFKDNSFMKTKLNETIQTHKNIPLYYRKISGKEFEEILSIMRRWITQDVGIDENGRTKDCLIIYDYFKLMSSSSLEDMQEFQALGFQISALSDFCGKYDVPCQAYVQLNRDGISKETSDIISQSDRLLWLCSSFAILKRKTSEEILIDGVENGNTKLIPTAEQRFGPGMEEGDYINLHVDREKCIMIEGKTKSEIKVNNSSGFETVEEDSDEYDDGSFDKVDYGDDQYRKDSGLWQGK